MPRITQCVLAFLLAAATMLAHAADRAASVYVEELTSTELAARVRAGATTVLVPIGGTEQNGAHMALGKHNARARALAGRIASALGNALVAPVIAYVPEGRTDPPSAHMRFPGTITITGPRSIAIEFPRWFDAATPWHDTIARLADQSDSATGDRPAAAPTVEA